MVWEKDAGRKNDTTVSTSHDYILVYAAKGKNWKESRNLLAHTPEQLKRYQNPDNDPRGKWRQGADGTAKSGSNNLRYEIKLPSGRAVTPPSGNFWRFSRDTFETALADGRVYFGKDGNRLPIIKKFLSEIQKGVVPKTWWPSCEVGSNQEARRDHLRKLLPEIEPFSTSKPERLLHRIIHIATNPSDLVLDSFIGSGTTAAVAHKMGRRWIGIELGEHCHTHCMPRLRKVIDGEDPGGITGTAEWKGGGGYRYYTLAPSLLEEDQFGNWVINKDYNGAMLAEAMCKLEGFVYGPSAEVYWQHGRSTESDFIYVTTQTLRREQIAKLSDEVGRRRSLLICCGAHRVRKLDDFPNLTLKKIPQTVMAKCEWGKDDYSLEIDALPPAPVAVVAEEEVATSPRRRRKQQGNQDELPLFAEKGAE
jgi:adenine-specific DNA-methyltransferase